ncbi:hypothetical protein [Rhodococcus opacus]|uniref:hypothetical protein n=1 Tax=Rhodococcus opacus TaxID=37919 RepID=UPI0035B06E99
MGVRKAASGGRLPSRRTGSGQRVVDRDDLDAYLGPPIGECSSRGWKRCTARCPARPVRNPHSPISSGVAGSVGAIRR